MVSEIDVSNLSPAQGREKIVDVFSEVGSDDIVTVRAGHAPEPALYQTQIKQNSCLTWTYEEEGPDSWELTVRIIEEQTSELVEFDVRQLPPQQRHTVLTETFEKLEPGEGFVLVNDHDPKPLYHELRSTHGDAIDWEYRSRKSDAWKVEVVKTDTSTATDEAVAASFDVREIPKEERHSTIHHRYNNLSSGDILEIIAPHEPRPLYREFRQQYGDRFEWEVREEEHGSCRVWITKDVADTEQSNSVGSQSVADLTITEKLDVREYPPAKRHKLIFESYEKLQLGEGFVLINDHDPKPLYHQFEAETGPEFHWEYQRQEPGEFRVLIGQSESELSEQTTSTKSDMPF